MKVVDRNELITLIRRKGGRASSSMSDAALASEANRLGMGAKKMGSNPGKRRRRSTSERGGPSLIPGAKRGLRPVRGADGLWWVEGHVVGVDVVERGPFRSPQAARAAVLRAMRNNPGPDPYRKDVLVMTPGGVSYTGPYGPFGSREWQPGLRGNPYPGGVKEWSKGPGKGVIEVFDSYNDMKQVQRVRGNKSDFMALVRGPYRGPRYIVQFLVNDEIAFDNQGPNSQVRNFKRAVKETEAQRAERASWLDNPPVGDYLLIAPPAPAAPTASNPSIEEFGGFRRGDRVTVGARSGRKGWSGIIYQFVPYGGYGFGDQPVVIVERTSDRSMQHVPMEWLKKTRTRGHRNPPMGDYLQIAGNPVGDYLQINPGLPRPGEIVPGRAGRAGRAGRRGRNPRAKNSPFHKGDEVFVPSGHRGVVAGASKGGKVKVKLARGGTMTFAASSLVHCDPSCHTHGML